LIIQSRIKIGGHQRPKAFNAKYYHQILQSILHQAIGYWLTQAFGTLESHVFIVITSGIQSFQ
jgi:hypothetical protein